MTMVHYVKNDSCEDRDLHLIYGLRPVVLGKIVTLRIPW